MPTMTDSEFEDLIEVQAADIVSRLDETESGVVHVTAWFLEDWGGEVAMIKKPEGSSISNFLVDTLPCFLGQKNATAVSILLQREICTLEETARERPFMSLLMDTDNHEHYEAVELIHITLSGAKTTRWRIDRSDDSLDVSEPEEHPTLPTQCIDRCHQHLVGSAARLN